MRAVVKISGRQYQVEEGRYLIVDRVNMDRLGKKDGDTLEFNEVLMVLDGDKTLLGAPTVKDAKVKAKVLANLRDKKVLVYKMRPKKGYRLKQGHRQELSRLQIEFIEFPGRTAPQVKPVERKPIPAKPDAAPKKAEKAASKKTEKAATVTETEAPKADKAAEAKTEKPETAKKASAPKAKKSEGAEKKTGSQKACR